ncbi:phospholipase D-like domain-containing protein [Pseudopedobacter sp.]|uniref:phospholipase D-like domain-containing protein n=1 Tax=Pseudopedobacter sp. TaxID=1936787 RepID=UPI00333FEACB
MKKNIYFMFLLFGAISFMVSSCKKIHHSIDEDLDYNDTPPVLADTTLVPVDITLPEVRFTQKEFYSAYLESNMILSGLTSLIDATDQGATIHMSIYQINQDDVLEALKRADSRGVNLRLLIDMSRLESQRINPKALNFLRNSNLKNAEIWDINNDVADGAINENRFVLFSEIETVAGKQQYVVFQASQSFTDADSRYAQDAVILSDQSLYEAYLTYWNELKARATGGMTSYNYFSEILNSGNIEAHFLPYRNNNTAINGDLSLDFLNRISNPATADIRIAMAYWDNTRIVILDKLISLAEQGAKVELVLKSNLAASLSRFEELESKGGFIRMINVNDNTRQLTNTESRFTLIKGTFDGVPNSKVVITGTHSFTGNSLKNSNGAIILLKDEGIYSRYFSYFDDLKVLPEFRSGGPIYPGFPETFEPVNSGDSNTFYADKLLTLSTGNWKINQSGLRNESADKIVSGTHAWRSNFNVNYSIYLAMDFDVPNGASKVSFYYGTWGNQSGSSLVGTPCTFQLEYSTNQGTTWATIGNPVTEAAWVPKLLTYDVDIQGPVRFRIHRKGQAATGAGNGRLNIDDFSVYQRAQ